MGSSKYRTLARFEPEMLGRKARPQLNSVEDVSMTNQERLEALRKWYNSTPHEMGREEWLSLLAATQVTET